MGKRGKTGEHLRGRFGPQSNSWKGGRKIEGGYILLYHPESPMADCKGYVLEHRFIVAKYIGRSLTKEDIVHHINGKKSENNIENLYLTNRRDHIYDHFPVKHTKHFKDFVSIITCAGCGIIFKPKRRPRFQNTFCSRNCWKNNHHYGPVPNSPRVYTSPVSDTVLF